MVAGTNLGYTAGSSQKPLANAAQLALALNRIEVLDEGEKRCEDVVLLVAPTISTTLQSLHRALRSQPSPLHPTPLTPNMISSRLRMPPHPSRATRTRR